MISTKRQIRRDDDRYGSFDADNASPLLSDFGISGDVDYIGNRSEERRVGKEC